MVIAFIIRIPQKFPTVLMASIVVLIAIVAILLPPAAVYANKDEGNPSSSGDDCKSDELPASIDGKIRCMEQGECYSGEFEFDGKEKEVNNCNFMMSTE
jgi:hypothetical protein